MESTLKAFEWLSEDSLRIDFDLNSTPDPNHGGDGTLFLHGVGNREEVAEVTESLMPHPRWARGNTECGGASIAHRRVHIWFDVEPGNLYVDATSCQQA